MKLFEDGKLKRSTVALIAIAAVAVVGFALFGQGAFRSDGPSSHSGDGSSRTQSDIEQSSDLPQSASVAPASKLASDPTGGSSVPDLKGVSSLNHGEQAFAEFEAMYECSMRAVGGGGFDPGADCDEQFTHEDQARMEDLLIQAAESGVVAAQLSYFGAFGMKFQTAEDIARDLDGFADFRSRSIRYLNDAARSGSATAMTELASIYENGVLVDADPTRAYAYWLAAQRAGVSSSHVEAILGRLGAGLTAEQLAEARRIADEVRCC